MKYLQSLLDWNHWTDLRSFEFNLVMIFLVFVLVYRWGVNRWIQLNWPRTKKMKSIYCSTCFGFWLTLVFSTNVLTAIMAFLIYSFYEKNTDN